MSNLSDKSLSDDTIVAAGVSPTSMESSVNGSAVGTTYFEPTRSYLRQLTVLRTASSIHKHRTTTFGHWILIIGYWTLKETASVPLHSSFCKPSQKHLPGSVW